MKQQEKSNKKQKMTNHQINMEVMQFSVFFSKIIKENAIYVNAKKRKRRFSITKKSVTLE